MVEQAAVAEAPKGPAFAATDDAITRESKVIEALRATRPGKSPQGNPANANPQGAKPPANAKVEGADVSGKAGEGQPETEDTAGEGEASQFAEIDPATKLQVKVSGELREVTFKDLRDSYASQGELQRLASAMVEAKKSIDTTRDDYVTRLESAKRLATSLLGEEPDPSKYGDWQEFTTAQKNFKARGDALKTIDAEIEKAKTEKATEAEAQMKALAAQEYPKILSAIPDFDKQIGPLMEYAVSHGVPDHVARSPQPAYLYEFVHKAMKWDALEKQAPAVNNRLRDARPMSRPGQSSPQDTDARQVEELKARLGDPRVTRGEKERIAVQLRKLTGQSRRM